ncbi:MAG: Flp pilus assembly protein TadG [Halioglobus sp.]|jgi:Flp pilus assembly protein TadG
MVELMGSQEFWPHLFQAPSFWHETIPIAVATLGCLAVVIFLVVWRSAKSGRGALLRARALPKDTGGAATVSDFALTIPIFIMVLFLMLQLALMANASLIIHYSAYSAARAAKTHLLDMDNAFMELECCGVKLAAAGLGALTLYQAVSGSDDDVRQKIRTAAAFPLIALAPGKKEYAANRTSSVNFTDIGMSAYLTVLTEGDDNRSEYLLEKAKYAFDNRYTKVEYGTPLEEMLSSLGDLDGDNLGLAAGQVAEHGQIALKLAELIKNSPASAVARITTIPVYADVNFRFPLLVPYAAAIFHQKDSSLGSIDKGIWLHARVELF